MAENVWLSGTVLIIIGVFIGIFGKKWFEPITGTFGALCAFVAFGIFASLFQWLDTTAGLIICIIVGLTCASLTYWVLQNKRIATMFLCIGGGFLLGGVVEGLIIAISGWESFVFYLIVTISFMVIGTLVGCYKADAVKRYLTACVGSYIFMRGWTFYFGGFPSEMEMYTMMTKPDSEPLDFTGLFWFYVCLWVASVFLCVYIQEHWHYVMTAEEIADEKKDEHYSKK